MAVFDLPDSATIEALEPYQGLWNDLVFGEGTDWIVEEAIDKLLAFESRISDQPIPADHGDISFGRWAAGRFVAFPFRILGGVTDHADRRRSWIRAFSPPSDDPFSEDWMIFRTEERIYMVRAKLARRDVELSPVQGRSYASHAVAEIKLSDPRVYDGDYGASFLLVPPGAAVGGGFDLPEDLPLDMTPGSGGTAVATNHGAHTAWPLIRVSNDAGAASDITEVVVTNVTYTESIDVITEIDPGKTLVIDFDKLKRGAQGPHVYIDSSSRYGDWQLPRIPVGVHPGSNIFIATVTGGTPTVRMDWLHPTL